MHKAIFAAALLLLLLPVPCTAQKIGNPQLINYASVSIDENGSVSALGGQMHDLSLNLSIPVTHMYQQVQSNDRPMTDSDGNSYIAIASPDPPNPFLYSRKIRVQSTWRATGTLPSVYVIPSELQRSLLPTDRTQSANRQIKDIAASITQNATTPFEKVALLAIYVHNHVTYTDSMVGQEKDALWVLQNQQGVCVEYATLFVAMARSIGIPARYVTGYVYSDRFETWLGHAWSEAYVGDWVPVDPTWFEVGSLDALHIEAAHYNEIPRSPALLVSVTNPAAEIKWDTSGKSGAYANNIATLEVKSADPSSAFYLSASSLSIPPGSSTLAFLTIAGQDYRVIPVTLAPCTGDEGMAVSPEGDQYLILEPGKNSTAVWAIRSGADLESNFVYTCPMTLNSPYLEHRRLDIQVDPRLPKNPSFSAAVQDTKSSPGKMNSVILSLPSGMGEKTAYLVTPEAVYEKKVSKTSEQMNFTTYGMGKIPLYVALQGGGYQRVSYESGSNRTMAISAYSIPGFGVLGKPSSASVRISSKSYPADFQLAFSFGGQETKTSGRLESSQEFELNYVPDKTGLLPARIALLSPDGEALDEKNELVTVFEQPDVSISSVKITKDSAGILSTVFFSIVGQPVSPIITIEGVRYRANDTLKIRLGEGPHDAQIVWADPSGNSYARQVSLIVKDPGVNGVLEGLKDKAKPAATNSLCPLLSVLLLVVLGYAQAKR